MGNALPAPDAPATVKQVKVDHSAIHTSILLVILGTISLIGTAAPVPWFLQALFMVQGFGAVAFGYWIFWRRS